MHGEKPQAPGNLQQQIKTSWSDTTTSPAIKPQARDARPVIT